MLVVAHRLLLVFVATFQVAGVAWAQTPCRCDAPAPPTTAASASHDCCPGMSGEAGTSTPELDDRGLDLGLPCGVDRRCCETRIGDGQATHRPGPAVTVAPAPLVATVAESSPRPPRLDLAAPRLRVRWARPPPLPPPTSTTVLLL